MEASTNSNSNPQKHEYMMLKRFQSDCDYFLGHGNRSERHLYFGNTKEHIQGMKDYWNQLIIKPIWLSMKEILNYEKEMTKELV